MPRQNKAARDLLTEIKDDKLPTNTALQMLTTATVGILETLDDVSQTMEAAAVERRQQTEKLDRLIELVQRNDQELRSVMLRHEEKQEAELKQIAGEIERIKKNPAVRLGEFLADDIGRTIVLALIALVIVIILFAPPEAIEAAKNLISP